MKLIKLRQYIFFSPIFISDIALGPEIMSQTIINNVASATGAINQAAINNIISAIKAINQATINNVASATGAIDQTVINNIILAAGTMDQAITDIKSVKNQIIIISTSFSAILLLIANLLDILKRKKSEFLTVSYILYSDNTSFLGKFLFNKNPVNYLICYK